MNPYDLSSLFLVIEEDMITFMMNRFILGFYSQMHLNK